MSPGAILIVFFASLVPVITVSYVVEALRPVPKKPEGLAWSADLSTQYVELSGITVRYLKTGTDISQAVVVGISIGGTIALVLAARHNPRIAKVIAVNPYDYWPAGGLRKSSLTARLVLTFSEVPVLGATFMRLRNRFVSDRIFEGGLASRVALPKELAKEFYDVGARPGHYQGFLNLLAHERLWRNARKEYPNINVSVLLVYGDQDWAPDGERKRTRSLIPGVVTETLRNGSHFLSLDRPQEMVRLIVGFARI
jgi:pimeloyl-ACP methyl ester carboxylesterase